MSKPGSIGVTADPYEIVLGPPGLEVQSRAVVSVSESYIPPGDEAVELPVDDLALQLLHLVDDGGQIHLLNRHDATWVGSWENHPGGEGAAFLHAIAEAWDWLASRLLIARRPGDKGEFAFITRRGERVLAAKDGPALLRAEERIDVDLHPIIATRVRRQFLLGEYELAALAAMREVEIRVRKLSKAGEEEIGVSLTQSAFKRADRSPTLGWSRASGRQRWRSSRARLACSRIHRATGRSSTTTPLSRPRSCYSRTFFCGSSTGQRGD